jgi:CRISPR/Cas system type I-B associated protein Csh2 (Cas7 group RAMP superfamily)
MDRMLCDGDDDVPGEIYSSACDTWMDVSLFTAVARARCNQHVSVNTAA